MKTALPRQLRRRFAAFMAVWLLAGSAVAQAAHEALVRHVRCPLHGEWVHEGATTGAAPQRSARSTIEGSVWGSGGHTHQHCAAATGRSPTEAEASPTSSRALVTSPASLLAAVHVRASRIPLYALAPKASPPS